MRPSPWHGPIHLLPTAPFWVSVGIGCFDASYGLWRVCCRAAGVCSLSVVAICSLLRTNAAVGLIVYFDVSKNKNYRKIGQLEVQLRGKYCKSMQGISIWMRLNWKVFLVLQDFDARGSLVISDVGVLFNVNAWSLVQGCLSKRLL